MLSILVIDDDKSVRDTLRATLEHQGFRVVTASNGREAMRKFVLDEFALVITDLVMPDVDGIAVLRQLKKLAPKVPVIAISGWPSAGAPLYLDSSLALGADAALAKPFTTRQIREEIDNCLRH